MEFRVYKAIKRGLMEKLVTTDKLDKLDISVKSDIGYNGNDTEALMSKLLIDQVEERKIQSLLAVLKGVENQPREKVELSKTYVHELVGLVEMLLTKKAIVLEVDPSPTQAGEIAGISRSSIMNLIDTGKLKAYPVGSHWRVKRDSLYQYIAEREKFGTAMANMDESGFGMD